MPNLGVGFQLITNASELQQRFVKRADSVRRYSYLMPAQFAMAIHILRKTNLQRMVYAKSPNAYKKPLTNELINGERVVGATAYNTSKHAKIRHDMKGTYAASGQNKAAEWVEVSVRQFRPSMILREQSVNKSILEGKTNIVF